MSKALSIASDENVSKNLHVIKNIFRNYHPRDFAVRLWDGTCWNPEPGQPARFTLVLQHPGALRSMFWPPTEVSLGEAYIYDDIDIEGDIESACAISDFLETRLFAVRSFLHLIASLFTLPSTAGPDVSRCDARLHGKRHSRERDRQAVAYHYDVSNDFFALWLDNQMAYSSAYFESEDANLDNAQEKKFDYICTKLRLKPGEKFLDIGCGWGGLLMHAVKKYHVEALGITLSRSQAELGLCKIDDCRLNNRCRIKVMDYRDLKADQHCDKIASVGMFEHVGQAKLPEYFQCTWKLLRPGGVFLNHGIGYTQPPKKTWWNCSFSDRYVFPDGELLPISTTLRIAEQCGFEVRDVESLREHYVLTLRNWVARLEAHHKEAVLSTNEPTYRIWRLYMAGSAYGFQTGRLNLFQTLLVKPDHGASGLPLTRTDWYR